MRSESIPHSPLRSLVLQKHPRAGLAADGDIEPAVAVQVGGVDLHAGPDALTLADGVAGELPRGDRKSTRLNSSPTDISRMPSSA